MAPTYSKVCFIHIKNQICKKCVHFYNSTQPPETTSATSVSTLMHPPFILRMCKLDHCEEITAPLTWCQNSLACSPPWWLSISQHTPHLCLRKQFNMSRLLYQFCLFTVHTLMAFNQLTYSSPLFTKTIQYEQTSPPVLFIHCVLTLCVPNTRMKR
jgi:hypothetical protein